MKVCYGGRVRKVNQMPANMIDFRRIIQQKFLNCHLQAPNEDQSLAVSRVLDESDINGDNSGFASLINQQIAERATLVEEMKCNSGKKGQKNTVDFQNSVCFYEDSEGDFNVISEDEDLVDATTYALEHNQKSIKCSIVPKKFFEDLRYEQN